MGVFEELREAGSSIVEAVGPSVVRIGRGPGRGSGVVVGEGAVLTNAHNVRGSETTVTFADGRRETGSVSGIDVDGDLAVVRVDTAGAPAVAWDGEAAAVGVPVFAVTVLPDGGTRVTLGTVSAVERTFRGPRGRLIADGVEHTAPLARGSSGSPVVDQSGRLVCLSTHRLGEGFYLGLRADSTLRARVDALVRGESPRRVYLGVALFPSVAARRLRASVGLPDREGLLVRGVDTGGPAARAGVQQGDLVVEAGGRAVTRADDLFQVLDRLGGDEPLVLRVVRGTDEVEIRVGFDETTAEGSA
jgi:serine protease Do